MIEATLFYLPRKPSTIFGCLRKSSEILRKVKKCSRGLPWKIVKGCRDYFYIYVLQHILGAPMRSKTVGKLSKMSLSLCLYNKKLTIKYLFLLFSELTRFPYLGAPMYYPVFIYTTVLGLFRQTLIRC